MRRLTLLELIFLEGLLYIRFDLKFLFEDTILQCISEAFLELHQTFMGRDQLALEPVEWRPVRLKRIKERSQVIFEEAVSSLALPLQPLELKLEQIKIFPRTAWLVKYI